MDGFKYSQAMLDEKAKGLTWTFENLDHFITAPKAFVPGTAMGFAGLKNDGERANVIAYLRTLSDSPVPLPASWPLLFTGLAGLLAFRRSHRNRPC